MQHAIAIAEEPRNADEAYAPPIARSHTILGVCEAFGETFGFNPILLRLPLAASLFFSPVLAISGYLLAGVIVTLIYWLWPDSRAAAVVASAAESPESPDSAELAANESGAEPLSAAA